MSKRPNAERCPACERDLWHPDCPQPDWRDEIQPAVESDEKGAFPPADDGEAIR